MMTINTDALVTGLSGLVVHALDGAAARLTDDDRPETAADEARDRDLIWAGATLASVLGDDAPAALRLWMSKNFALVEAVGISVEVAGKLGALYAAHEFNHLETDEATIPAEIAPFLDKSRHTAGEDGSVLVSVDPWEMEALHKALHGGAS